MLAIRMQRTGRKGYPTYRVVVQESHRQPTSGKVVANLGSYNPHTKISTLDKEKAALFLKNGAQPSDRVVKLLQIEKVKLPEWVSVPSTKKQKTTRNPEKLRGAPAAEVTTEETPADADAPAEEIPKEEPEAAEEVQQAETSESSEEAAEVPTDTPEEPKEEKK